VRLLHNSAKLRYYVANTLGKLVEQEGRRFGRAISRSVRRPSSISEHRVYPRNSSPPDSSENSLTPDGLPATTPRRRDTTVARTKLRHGVVGDVWFSSASSPTPQLSSMPGTCRRYRRALFLDQPLRIAARCS
jgi:hypothetical protein